MTNDVNKKQLIKFCLTNGRNLNVFKEVHGRDIYFAKSEQCYHLTSMDAEAVAVRSVTGIDRCQSHTPLYAYM